MAELLIPVQRCLDAIELPYEVLDCHPEQADTARFCEHYGIPLDVSANAILVRSRADQPTFALCVLLAIHRLNANHTVRRKLAARKISFASPEETRDITGMEIGGVTPLGVPGTLPIWVDEQVMQCDTIILGGGNRSSKLKISPTVFAHMPQCEVVPELARPSR